MGQIIKMLPSGSPIVCTTSRHIYNPTYDIFASASFIYVFFLERLIKAAAATVAAAIDCCTRSRLSFCAVLGR